MYSKHAILLAGAVALLFTCSHKYDSPYDPQNNKVPSAEFTITPPSGPVGTQFTFDATNSWDEDNVKEELRFRWDFTGIEPWEIDWTSNPVAQRQYNSPGEKPVILEVMDPPGAISRHEKTVIVTDAGANQPPFAMFDASRRQSSYRRWRQRGSS